eukprot:Platyproteum_vivax@DN6981_c0_g1_i4.p1
MIGSSQQGTTLVEQIAFIHLQLEQLQAMGTDESLEILQLDIKKEIQSLEDRKIAEGMWKIEWEREKDYRLAIDFAKAEGTLPVSRKRPLELDDETEKSLEEMQRKKWVKYGAFGSKAAVQHLMKDNLIFTEIASCYACTEAADVYVAPCNCRYCKVCLSQMFDTALNDRNLIPLRCCKKPFPKAIWSLVAKHPKAFQKYSMFLKEASGETLRYCCEKSCSQLLPDNVESNRVVCTACGAETCATCCEAFHGNVCVNAKMCTMGDSQFETLAVMKKWMRCPKCKRAVDLGLGCNHITCVCKFEFCYVCSNHWRSCHCPLWEETRLLQNVQRDM